ncbi:MAG: hypothetical protein K6E53_13765 [Lachnospiraceae bacterium]|nr:hypothetical protein [Lachnospiraceae bacterium]
MNDTVNLIEYFLTHDFCTAWDKNLWADIYNYGYIRDVGDWFISDKIGCKIGTMYALLHSLYEADIYSYCELIKLITGTFNSERHFIIYYSALCVRKFCPHLFEASDPDMDEITPDLFGFLLIKMFEGKACCHLEDESAWNWVRDKYMERVDSYKQKISNMLQYL